MEAFLKRAPWRARSRPCSAATVFRCFVCWSTRARRRACDLPARCSCAESVRVCLRSACVIATGAVVHVDQERVWGIGPQPTDSIQDCPAKGEDPGYALGVHDDGVARRIRWHRATEQHANHTRRDTRRKPHRTTVAPPCHLVQGTHIAPCAPSATTRC